MNFPQMETYINLLLDWITANPTSAGLVVALLSLLESLAIIGVIVPGVALLFGVGALIGTGVLDFWSMCSAAIVGAIIGDAISFFLGQHYHLQIKRHIKEKHLKIGHDFFNKHGSKSIIIGRFFGPIRAIIPLIAGIMQMPAKQFYFANIISALLWAPAYLIPGAVFGMAINEASESINQLVLILFLTVAAVGLGIYFFRKR